MREGVRTIAQRVAQFLQNSGENFCRERQEIFRKLKWATTWRPQNSAGLGYRSKNEPHRIIKTIRTSFAYHSDKFFCDADKRWSVR
jgi:hypothetical protein